MKFTFPFHPGNRDAELNSASNAQVKIRTTGTRSSTGLEAIVQIKFKIQDANILILK
jgi:hypothetical protein